MRKVVEGDSACSDCLYAITVSGSVRGGTRLGMTKTTETPPGAIVGVTSSFMAPSRR